MRPITFTLVSSVLVLCACSYFQTATNPDPNHTHADFAVFVDGTKLDFSAPQYMTTEAQEATLPPGSIKLFMHLHDGNGHVIHRHKPGLTFGDFFSSIGLKLTKDCLKIDAHQYASLDAGWKSDFGRTRDLCADGKFHWTMVVNGEEHVFDPGYVFADSDQIMLIYDSADIWSDSWKQMTNDACLYSKTCPWRGAAPTESCIADPTVPCKQ